MLSKFIPALVAMLMLSTAASAPMPQPAPKDKRVSAIRTLLQPWNRSDAPGAAVSVTLDGKVIASIAVGLADLEHSVPIKPASVFHAASLSKQFTAFAILLLEQDGKLSIDDPLAVHIPETAAWGPITLRQLMNHTSGLRDQWTLLGAAGWRAEDLVTDTQVLSLLLKQRAGNFTPGSAYQYNNSGYSLLAEVVRRVSGKSLREFCAARIFAPLGMADTHFQDDISDVVHRRAVSYRPAGTSYVRAILSYATAGPSGLLTTVEDLSRWALNFETRALGGDAIIDRMMEQGLSAGGVPNSYALGQERRPYKGFDTWSHGGRDAGFRSFLLRIPQQRFSVAVLGNAADFDTAKVAFAIADIFLARRPGYQPTVPSPIAAPTADMLAAYAGDYELFPGLIFTISTDGRRLFLAALGSSEKTALPPTSATTFQLDLARDIAVEFPSQPAGKAAGFQYRIGLHGALDAKRVPLSPFSADTVSLNDFVGRYHSGELSVEYELAIESKQLVARHPRRPAIVLQPYQDDTFSSPESTFQKLAFQRDAAGRLTGFLLSGAVAENIRFEREVQP